MLQLSNLNQTLSVSDKLRLRLNDQSLVRHMKWRQQCLPDQDQAIPQGFDQK